MALELMSTEVKDRAWDDSKVLWWKESNSYLHPSTPVPFRMWHSLVVVWLAYATNVVAAFDRSQYATSPPIYPSRK
jgi:hypothetical protein